MATLDLSKVFINLMVDGSYVPAQTLDRKRSSAIDGSVKTYGLGRRRGLSVLGDQGVVDLSLTMVATSDLALLERWKGQSVQIRTNIGTLFVGLYWKVDGIVDIKGIPGFYSCQIQLETITWPTEV